MQEPGTLWIHSVPQAIVDSVSDQEKKRQEAINEVIYTERDFVRDMEYLRDVSAILFFGRHQLNNSSIFSHGLSRYKNSISYPSLDEQTSLSRSFGTFMIL